MHVRRTDWSIEDGNGKYQWSSFTGNGDMDTCVTTSIGVPGHRARSAYDVWAKTGLNGTSECLEGHRIHRRDGAGRVGLLHGQGDVAGRISLAISFAIETESVLFGHVFDDAVVDLADLFYGGETFDTGVDGG